MCRSQNKPRKLSSPECHHDRAVMDELWRRIRDSSLQPRNLRQLQVALHQEWAWIPKNVVRRHMLLIRPRNEAVIAAGEGRVCFWTNLTKVN